VVQVVEQTPPLLEVAVDALTTDGDFDVLDGAFRGVDGRGALGGRAEAGPLRAIVIETRPLSAGLPLTVCSMTSDAKFEWRL
jgi:hypothetical protein